LGFTLAKAGDLDRGIDEVQKSIDLNPDLPGSHYVLAGLLMKKGERKAAAQQFQIQARVEEATRTQKLTYSQTVLHIGQGIEAMNAGNLKQAILEFQQAIQFQPDSVEAHNHLGVALARMGDQDGALKEFQRATELEPNDPTAYNNLGGLLAGKGGLEAAISNFEEAIKLRADFAEAHYNLGLVLLRKGLRERSMVEFQKARELDPRLKVPEL
jgi:Flp pilus assembly protein TadD